MIRPALAIDKARVVELLRDSRVGAGFDDPQGATGFVFPFEPAYAERLFARYLRGPLMLCLVHDVSGRAQGVLMAHAFEHDFGPVMLAQERVWWIDPAHRGGTAAPRMLDAYETWAANRGCAFAGMAGMGDDPVVMKLYQRRGYRRAETHCLKALC
jgi:GNAT superfamily N-acetyltransferase